VPNVIYRMAARALWLLPDRIVRAVLPARYGFDPDAAGTPAVPETPVRLYIGPVNSAGQGWQWARATERNLDGTGAVCLTIRLTTDFAFPSDAEVPATVHAWSRRWAARQREAVTSGFTHVLIESERTIFGDETTSSVAAEVAELTRAGLRVALVCHGSDIRLPSRHAQSSEWSPFRPGLWEQTPVLERQAAANAAILRALGLPVFVSTPDLLIDVPTAQWLPVVVDVDAWASATAPLASRTPPVVAHVPSRGVVKGTDVLDPLLRRLDEEGILRYRRIDGRPAAEMPEIYSTADVVLDQFRIGSYGVAACEAMAAGRIVVSHVSDQVRDHVRQATGLELPIVQATFDTLEEVLRGIIADPGSVGGAGQAGRDFVRAVHDGRRSAEILRPFLQAQWTA